MRARILLGAQVELEIRRRHAQLTQRTRLELTHALARDAEAGTDLFERLRLLAVETEAKRKHAAHARIEMRERTCELARARPLCRRLVWPFRVDVLDQVAVERLAVAHRSLERHRNLDEV